MFHEWQKAILALEKAIPPVRKIEDTIELTGEFTLTEEPEEPQNED